uniref:Uncharacterized protein n=1 Tax=Arundo donax TaxID=35708 RepID=A0A0A9BXB8_ARUDO
MDADLGEEDEDQ